MKVSRARGFTLLELLVMSACILLLTAVIVAVFSTAGRKSDDTTKISALAQVRWALNLYINENGYFPTTTALLVPKDITSVDPSIIYQATNPDNSVCSSKCLSFHLGVALTQNNPVLLHDADINAGFNGKNDTCAVSATNGPSSPDLCYDVTP